MLYPEIPNPNALEIALPEIPNPNAQIPGKSQTANREKKRS
jgi:hypothetical protein